MQTRMNIASFSRSQYGVSQNANRFAKSSQSVASRAVTSSFLIPSKYTNETRLTQSTLQICKVRNRWLYATNLGLNIAGGAMAGDSSLDRASEEVCAEGVWGLSCRSANGARDRMINGKLCWPERLTRRCDCRVNAKAREASPKTTR